MLDMTTRKPLYVSTDGDAGPYIMVPVELLGRVRAVLDTNKIPYWVDEEAISLDGKPEITVINISGRSDPNRVQALLDRVP